MIGVKKKIIDIYEVISVLKRIKTQNWDIMLALLKNYTIKTNMNFSNFTL